MPRLVLNGLQFPSVASLPSAANNPGVVLASGGILWFSNGVIWVALGAVSKNVASIVPSAAIATAETIITPAYSIPANTLYAGAAFRLTLYGVCSSTLLATSTFTIRLGTSGTVADAAVNTVVATGAIIGTNIAFKAEAIVTVRSIGSSGVANAAGSLYNSGTGGISGAAVVVAAPATAAVNTTVQNYLSASLKTSAAGTTNTINSSIIEQIA